MLLYAHREIAKYALRLPLDGHVREPVVSALERHNYVENRSAGCGCFFDLGLVMLCFLLKKKKYFF